MVVWRYVNLNIEEAQLLADLFGIHKDLESTEAICDLFIKELRDNPNMDILDALNTAALVKYARSFKGGVRSKIPESLLKNLPFKLQESHDFFIGLRDKHIAHSVNAFEENWVIAYLEKRPETLGLLRPGMNDRLERSGSKSLQEAQRNRGLQPAVVHFLKKEVLKEFPVFQFSKEELDLVKKILAS